MTKPVAAPKSATPLPALRPWLQSPAALWLAAFVSAALMLLHKTWALGTPQLWAEDGTVFLNDAEQYGLGALLRAYQGYLHLIPRLIVWAAQGLVDVVAWPLFYNSCALLVAVGVLARMTSRRVILPHKFWLVLAFGLVAQSGEVLLNITNVQWIAAFFLILQLVTTPPKTHGELAGDLVLLILAGLTGPFAVLLLPFFAWRAWREGNWRQWVLTAGVATCAAIQVMFLIRNPGYPTGPTNESFQWLGLLAVLGNRLVVWPFLGAKMVSLLPASVLAAIGTVVIGIVVAQALADRRRQGIAVQLLLVIAMLLAAAAWRASIDAWGPNDISFGDRYFFIPRLLFVWVVILQFDAPRRAWAGVACTLCVSGAVLELPNHVIPAPPDYHWAAHCEPLRRGMPAAIPTLPEGWIFNYSGRPSRR